MSGNRLHTAQCPTTADLDNTSNNAHVPTPITCGPTPRHSPRIPSRRAMPRISLDGRWGHTTSGPRATSHAHDPHDASLNTTATYRNRKRTGLYDGFATPPGVILWTTATVPLACMRVFTTSIGHVMAAAMAPAVAPATK